MPRKGSLCLLPPAEMRRKLAADPIGFADFIPSSPCDPPSELMTVNRYMDRISLIAS